MHVSCSLTHSRPPQMHIVDKEKQEQELRIAFLVSVVLELHEFLIWNDHMYSNQRIYYSTNPICKLIFWAGNQVSRHVSPTLLSNLSYFWHAGGIINPKFSWIQEGS